MKFSIVTDNGIPNKTDTTTTTTKPYLKTLYIKQPQSALQHNNYKKTS